MFGFANPRILLPTTEISLDELCFVLKHELVHYKRNDLLYKYLVLIATAVHWFNPVVYLAGKAIASLCEVSCDAEVVRDTDADTRQFYSEAMIAVVKYKSKLKTALSTNFHGGKKGMKNRISSIMDMSNKKVGFIVVCLAFVITIGTGFAFAANSNPTEPGVITATSENSTVHIAQPTAEQKSNRFEAYGGFGLTYDRVSDNLYFHGELVRYFEDYYPVGEGGSAGIDYFNKNGMVDIRAVRDLSQRTQNPDGSTDPSGKLMGLQPFSQDEFDARDTDALLNPPTSGATIAYTGMASEQNMGSSLAGTGAGNTTVALESGSVPTPDEYAEMYSIYEPFGVTYDKELNCFYYGGKLVRFFMDVFYSNGKSLTGGEFSGSMRQMNNANGEIDIHTVRDYTQLDVDGYGKLIGIEAD
jgi:hypothetical protein